MYSIEGMTVGKHAWLRLKMSKIYRATLYDKQVFAFFVLIKFMLSAKHFSVLPCYFMNLEDSVEKRWMTLDQLSSKCEVQMDVFFIKIILMQS